MRIKTVKILNMLLLLLAITETNAQTAGTLTFTYNQPTPATPSVTGGGNIYAVWIENASGVFIKTKARYVSTSTDDHLPTWGSKSGCSNPTAVASASTTGCNTTDATTGATRKSSTTPTAFGLKTITWDGKNVVGTTNGTTVADGNYKIWVESSWNDGANNIHNELIGFTFTKGAAEQTLTPAGDNYINTVSLHWLPTALAVDQNVTDRFVATIFPVPSTGLFNIDLKNNIDTIKVYDLLGKIVYNEQMKQDVSNSTITIDLSNLTKGNYIISLENKNSINNYEVIKN